MNSLNKFLKSFKYAANGIRMAVKQERNMRFHLCVALYVYVFSLFYNFSHLQYALITIIICGVISLEIVNSAFERLADDPCEEKYEIAGIIKDMAAGAVLVFSMGAVVCGVLLFWDISVFNTILHYFFNNIFMLSLLIISIVLCIIFIFQK